MVKVEFMDEDDVLLVELGVEVEINIKSFYMFREECIIVGFEEIEYFFE